MANLTKASNAKAFLEHAVLSPFTTLLRLHCSGESLREDESLRNVLQLISEENHILSCNDVPSIDVLIHSLQSSPALIEIYEYIDNCTIQLIRKTVKYHEQLLSLSVENNAILEGFQRADVDLLMIAITDQWPFLVKASTPVALEGVTKWIVSYLNLSRQAGRDVKLLLILRDAIKQNTKDKANRSALAQALEVPSSEAPKNALEITRLQRSEGCSLLDVPQRAGVIESPEGEVLLKLEPPKENDNHKILTRWTLESIPEIVLDGTLGDLTLCLCSQFKDIRRQALSALHKVGKSLKVRQPKASNKTYSGNTDMM